MKIEYDSEYHKAQKKKKVDDQLDQEDPIVRYFDGMGTGTARLIIDKHFDDTVWEKYGIKRLKNTGRYYIARIVDKGGELIDEVLIDKQNGSIQSLLRRTGP